MALIEVKDLAKSFGQVRAVDGVSLHIEAGEFITLLGPSGSGKTTVLRLIAGFEDADAGSITLSGEEITHLPPFDRDVNTVFQDYALFPHMTIQENVEYGLRNRKVPKPERAKQALEAIASVKLEHVSQRLPHQLSGGQRQRIALARSLVLRPRVLLLDEPLGALDRQLREEMQSELKRIQREAGITFVFVTHDQEEAMRMSDRIVVFNEGKIEQIGTPEEVYGRPATTFVAGFIGSPPMNLIKGTVSEAVFVVGGAPLALPGPAPRQGGELMLGVRPEHVQMDPAGPWALTVEVVEMLGAERLVHGRLRQEGFTLRIDGTLAPPAPGQVLRVGASPQRLHWFDPATGARVA